ncbi:MAG: carbohydrate-binding module family 20 domain-containing protein [Bacteroidota bacterium]
MRRSTVLFIASLLLATNVNAQNSFDSLITRYYNTFVSSDEILIVKGRLTDKYPAELNEIFLSWENENLKIKYEDELDSLDLKKHLQFYGPIGSYVHLQKFLPKVLTVTENGFSFGPYDFTDSLDAISIFPSECDRYFQISNSFTGLKTLWTTFQYLSQYFIMQNWAITHHGFLLNNEFDPANHYDVWKLRKKQLIEKSTKYYTFYYDPSVFVNKQNADSLFLNEDKKVDNILSFFGLAQPERKIECFLYKDFAQKYYLSATPGSGNIFIKAYQNHSIGLGVVEHESIHILFNDRVGSLTSFFSEGVVGYYYACKDSSSWKRTRMLITNSVDFSIKKYLVSSRFNFSSEDYAASAFFIKYLIDSYGLEKFKSFCKAKSIEEGFAGIYGMNIDQVYADWNNYFESYKIPLGPDRKIIVQVICKDLPDSSKIFITGDHQLLSNWNPGKIILEKQNDGVWFKEFAFPEGSIISYKITRGSWDKEALDQNGNVPGNSIYEVKQDDTIVIHVNKWKDQLGK